MIMSLIAQSFGNKGKAKGGNLSFNVKGGGGGNVQGKPIYSVMAAGWFCEKFNWIGKVENVKPVL